MVPFLHPQLFILVTLRALLTWWTFILAPFTPSPSYMAFSQFLKCHLKSLAQQSMCYRRLELIPLQLIPNPGKSLWFHIAGLYCTDGDFADDGQIGLFPFSYQVFIYETCSCCECVVEAGHGCRVELSSPVVQQGKAGNTVIIEVIEEQIWKWKSKPAQPPKLVQWSHITKLYQTFPVSYSMETWKFWINGTGAHEQR